MGSRGGDDNFMLTLLASIDGGNLVDLLIQLVIGGVIFFLLVWLLGWCKVPEPFLTVAKVLIGLVLVVWLINLLLGLGGHSFIH